MQQRFIFQTDSTCELFSTSKTKVGLNFCHLTPTTALMHWYDSAESFVTSIKFFFPRYRNLK